MTIKAYKDNADGYYQADVPAGHPDPAWVTAKGLTPTPVMPTTQPTALELLWMKDMQATDSTCPRWFEDYVTENSVALAPGKSKESYDAKVSLRSNKPK